MQKDLRVNADKIKVMVIRGEERSVCEFSWKAVGACLEVYVLECDQISYECDMHGYGMRAYLYLI